MKNTFKIIILVLALTLALTACDGGKCDTHIDENSDGLCDNCKATVEVQPKKGNKVGDICHSYDLELLLEDGKVNIEDYRGKVVVINFWGTWCNPCKAELPHFNDVAGEMADEVVIITVHSAAAGTYNPEMYDVTAKLPDSKIIFAQDTPIGTSTDKYYTMLGCKGGYPYTIILDADGIITHKQLGAMSKDVLVALIEEAKS